MEDIYPSLFKRYSALSSNLENHLIQKVSACLEIYQRPFLYGHQLNNHRLKVHIPISDRLPVLRCIHGHFQSQHQ